VVSLAIPLGIAVGGLAFRRFAPRGFRFVAGRGLRAFRARQIQGATAGAAAIGVGAGLATEALVSGVPRALEAIRRDDPMQNGISRRPSRLPVRRGQSVTPGPVPVEFVKSWRACEALFAIDDQGHRWVWRPKLGIWKRIRVTRNIVISGKDIRRARRLVRISKRLNKMRAQIR